MAELVKDLVTLALKTMFGIMMGINVIQGLIVPVSAELQNSTLIKAGGAIPGVGNTISTVTNTVLVAAKLVKNAVGVAGVIAVFYSAQCHYLSCYLAVWLSTGGGRSTAGVRTTRYTLFRSD